METAQIMQAPDVNQETVSQTSLSPEEAKGTTVQHISFAIDTELYGVDIMSVREIKAWSEVTPLPRQPEYVRGVLNLRGVVVPIFDLRCRFGNGRTDATLTHVIIIVEIKSKLIGLLVDRVSDIVTIETGNIQPVPATADSDDDLFEGLVAIENEMIALLDLEKLGSEFVQIRETLDDI